MEQMPRMVRIELRHQVSAVFATPLRCTPEMRRDNAAYIAPSLLDIGGGGLYISIVRNGVYHGYFR